MTAPTRYPQGRSRPVQTQPTPVLTTRPLEVDTPSVVGGGSRWELAQAVVGDARCEAMLGAGWEPFGVHGSVVSLRRRVP